MSRYALLVATAHYADPIISDLRTPAQDVSELASVLEDPAIGAFDAVRIVHDTMDYEMRMAIEDFLVDRYHDDLVLLYFSCHGCKDERNRLYFAASNTRRDRLASTAMSRAFLNDQLDTCRAGARVLLLDCCFSGAYSEGFKAATTRVLDGNGGEGYLVITASDDLEYAFEGDRLAFEAPTTSVFTDVLVEGLRTGAADLDQDGEVRVDELFRYVHDGVVKRNPKQTPRIFAHRADPHVVLARSARTMVSDPQPASSATSSVVRHPRATYTPEQIQVARGILDAAKLVSRTLGPMGRKCVVRDQTGAYVEASDAVTIVEHLSPEDPRDTLGASYIRDVVREQRHTVGDGSATAAVLAHAMVSRAMDALRAGAHPISLKRGIEAAVERVSDELSKLAKDVETKEQIASAASTCAGDATIGLMIAEAMSKVGKEGIIIVEESNAVGTEFEFTEGMRFDTGYASPYFATDDETLEAVLKDPYILVVNSWVSANNDLLPLLERVLQTNKPLAIIAKRVEGEALATLVVNKIRDILKSVAITAPGSGAQREAMLSDIAILTGGQVIGGEMELKAADLDLLGRARRVIVTKNETTIVDGAGEAGQIADRVDQIQAEINNIDSGYEREMLVDRLAMLANGVALIRVGGAAEDEVQQRIRRAESAILIARRAIESGLLPGGGAALLDVQRRLSPNDIAINTGITPPTPDEITGAAIVITSLAEPLKLIAANAGHDPDKIAKSIMSRKPGTGFDVVDGSSREMLAAGISDTTSVVTQAVANAASVVERLLLLG